MKIIREYADKGVTAEELQFTKSSIGQSDARKYETNGQKAAFLSRIQQYGLKANFVDEQNKILNGMTTDEFDELSKKYMNVNEMTILVVGDKEKIMPGLQRLGYHIVELDADGNIKQN